MLALSIGQILFKLAARGLDGTESLLSQIMVNHYLWIALAVYAIATVFWIGLLRQIPLNLAYPFVALAFFFVPVLGHWILDEPLRWQNFLNLKSLWNGSKKAAFKVGEHYAEQNPLGKGAIAFLEGVMEEPK